MLYFVSSDDGYIHIGHTRLNPKTRVPSLQLGNPHDLSLIGSASGTLTDLRALQAALKDDCVRGTWYHASENVMGRIRAAMYGPGGTAMDAVLRHSLAWAPVSAWEASSNAAAEKAGYLEVQDGQARRTQAGQQAYRDYLGA